MVLEPSFGAGVPTVHQQRSNANDLQPTAAGLQNRYKWLLLTGISDLLLVEQQASAAYTNSTAQGSNATCSGTHADYVANIWSVGVDSWVLLWCHLATRTC